MPPEAPHAHASAPPSVDALLPEKPPVHDGVVSIGHLHVDASVYSEFRSAMQYDGRNPETAGMLKRLSDGPTETSVHLEGDPDRANVTQQNGKGSSIAWDPKSVVVDAAGHSHSPAIVIGHELKHADHHNGNPAEMQKRLAEREPGYSNAEERSVIDGWEKRTNLAVGEPVRHDHMIHGSLPGHGVTSTEAVVHQTRDGRESELRPGYSQSGKILEVTDTTVVQSAGRGTVSYPRAEIEKFVPDGQPHLQVGDQLNVAVGRGEVSVQEQAPSVGHTQQLAVPQR